MKKTLASFLLLSLILLSTSTLNVSFAQVPPAPPSNHGESGNKGPSGDAPLEDGMGISLILAAVYGGFIVYKMRRKEAEIKLQSK